MNIALNMAFLTFMRRGPARFVSYEDIMYAILSNIAEVLILRDMILLQEKTPGSIFNRSLSTITRYSTPLLYQKMQGVAALAQCRETTEEDLI